MDYCISSVIRPVLLTYMFLSIYIKSAGSLSSITSASHSYYLFILSYARFRSMNAILSFFPVFKLCCMHVCKMSACSIVVWWALNPAYVGACRFIALAYVVNRWFIVAMKTLAIGGVIAMLL